MTKIEVSQEVLIAIAKACNLDNLQKDKAKSIQYRGQKYVCTGWSSTAKGYTSVSCCKAVLQHQYDGRVLPMNGNDHMYAVLQGTRDRGYYARLLAVDGVTHVLTDAVYFVQEEIIKEVYQPLLFDIEPIQPVAEQSFKKPPATKEQIKKCKRKFNASYRLRKKLGENAFPKKSKIIFSDINNLDVEKIKEVKILIKENGFIVQPLAFTAL
jgi:hypothetical protein